MEKIAAAWLHNGKHLFIGDDQQMEKQSLCDDYQKYYPMIKNRARSWARPGVIGLEKEDLESIGNEVFMECCSTFNGSTKFSTWLWKCLNNRFYVECNYKKIHCEDIEPIQIANKNENIESQVVLKQSLQKLSSDAQFIVNSALNTPIEMINQAKEETGRACICLKRIQRHLIENEGWGVGRCWRGFKEIRKALA